MRKSTDATCGWRAGLGCDRGAWGSRKRRWGALTFLSLLVLVASGCGKKQSTLDPHSSASHDIATLWWWMLVAATIVFVGAVALLLLAWRRRERPGLPLFGESEKANMGLVVGFGMVIPVITLIALFIVSNLYVLQRTDAPAAESDAPEIAVTGHQWFWEVRYPGTSAVTANEIHIPAGTDVTILARSADVIHSFWVPELNRKIDMIPGRTNEITLHADHPGVFRGQCAEFCGVQHAHMVMKVFADPPAKYKRWVANMAKPALPPQSAEQRAGMAAFASDGCSSCHQIRGTAAQGQVGPDLTHLASRTTIAGAILPNTPAKLREWIRDPQHFKPGNKMPMLNLSDRDLDSLVSYLDGLR